MKNQWYTKLYVCIYIWGFRAYQLLRWLAPVSNDLWWLWWPMICGDRCDLSFPDNCLTLILKILYVDVHIDGKYWEKKLCLSWDMNLRSPVLCTGDLINLVHRDTHTNSETNLSLINISIQDSQNVIAYYVQFLLESNTQVGIMVGFTLYIN